jgi:cyanate permease
VIDAEIDPVTDRVAGRVADGRSRYVVGALIVLVHVALGLNLFAPASLLPLVIDDFGVTRTVAGLLVAGPVLIQAFVGLPGGTMIRRIGAYRSVTIGAALVGAGALSFVVTGFVALLVARLLVGAGAALVIIGTGPLIMQWFPPRQTALMNTMFLVALSSGISIGVLGAAPLAAWVGWREALGVFGVAALAATGAWVTIGARFAADDAAARPAEAPRVDEARRSVVRGVLGDRTVQVLIVADSLVFIQYSVLTTWLPTFFNESRGMSVERAGLLTGVLPGIGIGAVIVGGVISSRARSWKALFVVSGVLVGAGGFATFLVTSHVGILVSVIVLGIGTWVYQPTFHTAPMQLPWMTPDRVAVVWGASMTFAGIGMFVAPIVVGASRDVLGSFVPGFVVWAVLSWSLLLLGLRLPASISGPRRDEQIIDSLPAASHPPDQPPEQRGALPCPCPSTS